MSALRVRGLLCVCEGARVHYTHTHTHVGIHQILHQRQPPGHYE